MARFSLGRLARTAGRGLVGFRKGQIEGDALNRALERQQFEFALRVAPQLRQQRLDTQREHEDRSLDTFLGGTEEGRDLASTGMAPTAKLGIYSGRLAARRQQQPTPTQTHTRERQDLADLAARAKGEAEFLIRTGQNPTAPRLFTYLRGEAAYTKLDDATLRGIVAEALGAPKTSTAPDLRKAVQRAAEALGVSTPQAP